MWCAQDKFSWRLMWYPVASAALAILSGVLRREHLVPAGLLWAVALLPVLPMVGFFVAMARWLRRIDEMQRLIYLEALLVQFAGMAILVMAYGMLAKVGAVPDLTMADAASYLWIAIFVFWAVGLVIVRRKYL